MKTKGQEQSIRADRLRSGDVIAKTGKVVKDAETLGRGAVRITYTDGTSEQRGGNEAFFVERKSLPAAGSKGWHKGAETDGEPLGAQLLKRIHEDHSILMKDYDELLGVVEQDDVKRLVTDALKGHQALLSSVEKAWRKAYKDLPEPEGWASEVEEGKDLPEQVAMGPDGVPEMQQVGVGASEDELAGGVPKSLDEDEKGLIDHRPVKGTTVVSKKDGRRGYVLRLFSGGWKSVEVKWEDGTTSREYPSDLDRPYSSSDPEKSLDDLDEETKRLERRAKALAESLASN